MHIPKTKECCGRKPKRYFIQTSFRDDEGKFVLECRKKCGNRVDVENMYRGLGKVEIEAVEEWNSLIGKTMEEK